MSNQVEWREKNKERRNYKCIGGIERVRQAGGLLKPLTLTVNNKKLFKQFVNKSIIIRVAVW